MGVNVMKASEYIKQHGDFEITEDIEKCIPHKPKSVWDLEIGDICYYANQYHEIKQTKWDIYTKLLAARSIGLVTLTREELEFKIESMKVYEELKRYAKEFTNEEWEDATIPKFEIYFEYRTKKIDIDDFGTLKCNQVYFESYEKAKEAIKAVGEERVKMYYLGVGKWNNVQIIDLK